MVIGQLFLVQNKHETHGLFAKDYRVATLSNENLKSIGQWLILDFFLP